MPAAVGGAGTTWADAPGRASAPQARSIAMSPPATRGRSGDAPVASPVVGELGDLANDGG